MERLKKILILSDCANDSMESFIDGIKSQCDYTVDNENSRVGGYNSLLNNALRYANYFLFPLRYLYHRKHYDYVMGWQQFYAIAMGFYCRLFHLQKYGKLVVINFTYKRKHGLAGDVFHWFMKYACNSRYIDFFHVPSNNYVKRMNYELGIPNVKFIVTQFGIDDILDRHKDAHTGLGDYVLSIGRSNRDFNWLVSVWRQDCLKRHRLVILSDVWTPKDALPGNVTWRNDINGMAQYAYFNDAQICVTPIADGEICSGDTVLLTSMMFAKAVVVTENSTLAEMYVRDGHNGLCVSRNIEATAKRLADLLEDRVECRRLGDNARRDYMDNFSRRSMGIAIMRHLLAVKED